MKSQNQLEPELPGVPGDLTPRPTAPPARGKAVYRIIQPSRLYEQIVRQIEESILTGRIKTGEQLPAERELAQQFGVSRSAVREAVKALREKGLVEAYSGRGTFVTNGTSESIRQSLGRMIKIGTPDGSIQLAEVRAILEPEIAALAATRVEEQHLSAMRDAVSTMDQSFHSPETFIEADLDFHLSLAEAAANPLILLLIDPIIGVLREQRIRIFKVDGGPERGQFHHKRILQAVEHRDPVKARQFMQAHLSQVREDCQAPVAKAETLSKPSS